MSAFGIITEANLFVIPKKVSTQFSHPLSIITSLYQSSTH